MMTARRFPAMKCPRWIIWNTMVALSLMACLATLALWIRSRETLDRLQAFWSHLPDHASIYSRQGLLQLDTPLIAWPHDLDGGVTYQARTVKPDVGYSGIKWPPRPGEDDLFFWGQYDPSGGMGSGYAWGTHHRITVPHGFGA